MEIHTDPYTVRMIKKERVHDIVVVRTNRYYFGYILFKFLVKKRLTLGIKSAIVYT